MIEFLVIICLLLSILIALVSFDPTFDVIEIDHQRFRIMWYNGVEKRKWVILWRLWQK